MLFYCQFFSVHFFVSSRALNILFSRALCPSTLLLSSIQKSRHSRPGSANARSRPSSAKAKSRPASANAVNSSNYGKRHNPNNLRPGSAPKARLGGNTTAAVPSSPNAYPSEQSVQFYNIDGGSKTPSSSSSSAVNQANIATPPLRAFSSALYNYNEVGRNLQLPYLTISL